MTDDEAFLIFCWEKIVREVDRCCDMRGSDLVYLVRTCLTQSGRFTREQVQHTTAPGVRAVHPVAWGRSVRQNIPITSIDWSTQ